MSWIKTISPDKATDLLRREYDAAIRRAGRIWNIVRIMSVNPRSLHASMELYSAIMHSPSGLSRVEREMLAIVVSQINHCRY